MTTLYLIEFAAFKQIEKIVDEKNGKILKILFHLYDHAEEKVRKKLPLFARLLCKITPDPYSWTKDVEEFKMKFLGSNTWKLEKYLCKEEIKFLENE